MQKDMEYIYSLRKYILAAAGFFIVSLMVGLAASKENPGISQNYIEMFKQSFGWIKSLNPLLIMLIIFLNNVLKSFMAFVLGIGFGIVPFFFVAGNGIILGMFAGIISEEKGVLFVIASILPHGIIEVPMILISVGLGLRLGHVMFMSLKGLHTNIVDEFKQGLRFYLKRIVPLLFIAAFIETFITPLVASQFAG